MVNWRVPGIGSGGLLGDPFICGKDGNDLRIGDAYGARKREGALRDPVR